MTVLTKPDLTEGKRLADLRGADKEGTPGCSCGRSIRRCTVAQKFGLFRKGEKVVHEDLTYEAIERKYFDWIVRYGYLLIEYGLENIEKEK